MPRPITAACEPASYLSPSTARTLCSGALVTGKVSPDLRAWLAQQINDADDVEESRVGALRTALFHLNEADVPWRLLAHAGQALADALIAEEGGRAGKYAYQVGSAGQVR